jgi:hypothetical protein
MVSTRSTPKQRASKPRPAAHSASTEAPRDALVAVVRHAARIQIAAATAVGTALAGWARAADRLAQAVGNEVLRRVDGEADTDQLVVNVASATSVHLRELTAVPTAAVDRFNKRLERDRSTTRRSR